MKRPGYDLTWKGIRRRWSPAHQEANSIKKNVLNEYYDSVSISLVDAVNKKHRSCQSIVGREEQRSNSAVKFLIPLLPKVQSVQDHRNLSKESHSCDMEMIRSELRTIVFHLATLTKQARQQEELDTVSQDWKFVAMIIDRLCLIVFSISMTLFTALTLFSNPTFFKLR